MKKAQQVTERINRKYIRNIIKVEYICTAFEANYNPDFYFSGEFHPFWEFVYVISGNIGVSSDDRIYCLHEGDIIFHKPMEFHKLWALDNTEPHLFIMSFNMEGSLLKKLESGVFALTDEQKDKVLDLLCYLKTYTTFSTNNNQVTHFLNHWDETHISQNVANRMESLFITFENQNYLLEKQIHSHEEMNIYKQITSILMDNINTWISLDEIASKCGMSKSHLKRVFSTTSSVSIHKYFIKLKIAESMKLLLSGLSVAETAEVLEFSSPNYFSTVFKRETGVSPNSYRKNTQLFI